MGEAVGTDPLPENVDGTVIEQHVWNHDVQHSVQWDYVLLALAAVAVAWYLFGGQTPDREENREAVQTAVSG